MIYGLKLIFGTFLDLLESTNKFRLILSSRSIALGTPDLSIIAFEALGQIV